MKAREAVGQIGVVERVKKTQLNDIQYLFLQR